MIRAKRAAVSWLIARRWFTGTRGSLFFFFWGELTCFDGCDGGSVGGVGVVERDVEDALDCT